MDILPVSKVGGISEDARRVRFLLPRPRVKFLIFIGTNVGASIGWAAGEPYGIMTAFIVSGIGSAAGVYAGWWAARRWLE